MNKWDPSRGFRLIYEPGDEDGTDITDEELEGRHIYLTYDGRLIRVEPYIDSNDGMPKIFVSTPKDLILMPR